MKYLLVWLLLTTFLLVPTVFGDLIYTHASVVFNSSFEVENNLSNTWTQEFAEGDASFEQSTVQVLNGTYSAQFHTSFNNDQSIGYYNISIPNTGSGLLDLYWYDNNSVSNVSTMLLLARGSDAANSKFVVGWDGTSYLPGCNINYYCVRNAVDEVSYVLGERYFGWSHVRIYFNNRSVNVTIQSGSKVNSTTFSYVSPHENITLLRLYGRNGPQYSYVDSITLTSGFVNWTLTPTIGDPLLNICNGTIKTLEFVVADEETNLNISSNNVDVTFNYWRSGINGYTTLSLALNGSANYSICMANYTSNIYTDAIISYDSPGYVTRNYYLINYSLSNESAQVYLHLLSETNSSNLIVNLVNPDGEAQPNYYVKMLRYYPGLGTYKTVEVSKSNGQGSSLFHVLAFSAYYKFIVQDYDDVKLITSDPCEQILVTPITLFFLDEQNSLSTYQKVGSVQSSLTYNNISGVVSFTYSDTNGVVQTGCLKLLRKSSGGDDVVCEQCSSSSAATVYCTITDLNTSATYVAVPYVDTNTANSNYGFDQLFISVGQAFNNRFSGVGFSVLILVGTLF